MQRKKKKRKFLKKIKIVFSVIVFAGITFILGYNCFSNIIRIRDLLQEKASLEDELVSLEEEHDELEADISKLEDPDYIAKYVREKYFYSKDGEIILRIDE